MKKLSIVIITLNEKDYIGNLLDDLVAQSDIATIGDIIVCDGGSTDGTAEIVLEYKQILPIKLKTASRRGYGLQKNEGVESAKEDLLVFMDADIRIGADTAAIISQLLMTEPQQILVCPIRADSHKLRYRLGAKLVDTYFRFLTKSGYAAASGQCIAMSRQTFETLDGFDSKAIHGEDLDLLLRARKLKIDIKYASDVLVKTSMRRFETVGTIRLLLRYTRSEIHRVWNHGTIKKDYIGYDKKY